MTVKFTDLGLVCTELDYHLKQTNFLEELQKGLVAQLVKFQ